MELLTGVDEWVVTLTSGCEVRVWASGYAEEGGRHVFSVLARVPAADEDQLTRLTVVGRTPSDPERFLVAVASIPSVDVANVLSA